MLGHDGGALTFTIGDDGGGFDQAATPMGTGVQGMSDRLAALGGTLPVTSAPGHGTPGAGRGPGAPDLSSRRRRALGGWYGGPGGAPRGEAPWPKVGLAPAGPRRPA